MTLDLTQYDTDKSEEYIRRYRREFGHLFNTPIRVLELGVQRGGSMYLWRDLLPKATIAGLDLNEIHLDDDSGRLHIYRGFQQDPAVLDRIAAEVAPDGFDVIIDDASHLGTYTAASFWHLFPRHLKAGGTYVIDDWGSGYWNDWADGHAFSGDRSSLGDFPLANGSESGPTRVEEARRRIRTAARPLAAQLPPTTRRRLEKAYMKIEGASVKRRFKSHDYGMVGFVKQLLDACAIADIDRGKDTPFANAIESVHVYPSQVFVQKQPVAEGP
jgi:hypothetical protein